MYLNLTKESIFTWVFYDSKTLIPLSKSVNKKQVLGFAMCYKKKKSHISKTLWVRSVCFTFLQISTSSKGPEAFFDICNKYLMVIRAFTFAQDEAGWRPCTIAKHPVPTMNYKMKNNILLIWVSQIFLTGSHVKLLYCKVVFKVIIFKTTFTRAWLNIGRFYSKRAESRILYQ